MYLHLVENDYLDQETIPRYSASYRDFAEKFKALLQLEKPDRSQYRELKRQYRFWLAPSMNAYDALLLKCMRLGAQAAADQKKLLEKTRSALQLQLRAMDDDQIWLLYQGISQLSRTYLKPLKYSESSGSGVTPEGAEN